MSETVFDFEDGNGPVPAHQHPNGGGWVADTAYVSDTSYVGPLAQVFGKACVMDSAVQNYAKVYGRAVLIRDSKICEYSQVFGNATVSQSQLFGTAKVYGISRVRRSFIGGQAKVYGDSSISGTPIVQATIDHAAILSCSEDVLFYPSVEGRTDYFPLTIFRDSFAPKGYLANWGCRRGIDLENWLERENYPDHLRIFPLALLQEFHRLQEKRRLQQLSFSELKVTGLWE